MATGIVFDNEDGRIAVKPAQADVQAAQCKSVARDYGWAALLHEARYRLPQRLRDELQLEQARGIVFLLYPVFFGAGAINYYLAAQEPGWFSIAMALAVIATALLVVRRHPVIFLLLSQALLFQLGVLAAKTETVRYSTQLMGADVTTLVT